MGFRVNQSLQREDSVRALLPERAYVRWLQEKGQAVRIDNVIVDAPEIIARRFLCDTAHCARLSRKRGKLKGSCCTDLEVDLTPNEIRRIRRLARLYLESGNADPEAPFYAVARGVEDDDGWMDENHLGEPRLTHTRKKVCSMGFLDEEGRLLCALNAMAEALGAPVAKWKLQTSFLFPLHYVEYKDGEYLLTIIAEDNYENMEGCAEAARLRCVRKPPADAPRAYQSLRHEIETLLGKRFYRKLERAAEDYLAANP